MGIICFVICPRILLHLLSHHSSSLPSSRLLVSPVVSGSSHDRLLISVRPVLWFAMYSRASFSSSSFLLFLTIVSPFILPASCHGRSLALVII